jgi:hypothetical protein
MIFSSTLGSFNIIQHHLHIIYTFYTRIFCGKPFGKFAVGTSPDLEVSTVSTSPGPKMALSIIEV